MGWGWGGRGREEKEKKEEEEKAEGENKFGQMKKMSATFQQQINKQTKTSCSASLSLSLSHNKTHLAFALLFFLAAFLTVMSSSELNVVVPYAPVSISLLAKFLLGRVRHSTRMLPRNR